MANNIQQVGFMSPGYDYSADQINIERQRALADQLKQQALQQGDTQVVGGWAVPQSGIGTLLSKVMTGAASGYEGRKAEEKQRGLAAKAQSDLANVLRTAAAAGQGNPQPSPEMGGGPARPSAAEIYMSHPLTAPLGMQLMQQQVQRQALVNAMRGSPAVAQPGQPGMSPTTSQAAFGTPEFATQPKPTSTAIGGPAGGVPMEMWLATDPTGQKYMEQLAKDNAPISTRYGIYGRDPSNPEFMRPIGGALPQGALPFQMGPNGQADVRPYPGQAGGVAALTAAGEYGRAPFQLDTINTAGAPTLMTRQQQIEAATGRPMPTPGSMLSPQAAAPAPAAQPAPTGAPAPMQPPAAAMPTSPPFRGARGLTLQDQSQSAANTEAGKEFIAEMRKNYGLLRDVPATLQNIDRAKALAAGQAKNFMGPLGESKLEITKFLRSNVPGMENLQTPSVTGAEEIRAALFNQVMDNLKKMDAQPSQYQQQVMQQAFGTLGTDPQAIPKMLNVFGDILRTRVDIHNQTVDSAEKRGILFPYDVRVKLGGQNTLNRSGPSEDPLGLRGR